MSKITLNNVADLTSSSTAQSTINTNSSTVQTAFDNTLSRDGTSPNTMGAALDMNSFAIMNLPSPVSINSPARLADVQNLVAGGSITLSPLPAGGTQNQILAKNSSANYDASWFSNINVGTITGTVITGNSLIISSALAALPNDVAGGHAVNIINVPSDNVNAGNANTIITGERRHVCGGSSLTGARTAGYDSMNMTTVSSPSNTIQAYVGHYSQCYTNCGDGGTNTAAGSRGGYFASNPNCIIDSGGVNITNANGIEVNTEFLAGSSVRYGQAVSIVGFNAIHASQLDCAISISGGGGHVGWNNLFVVTDANRGTTESPVNSSTTLFGTRWESIGTQTVTNGWDLTGFTFTGNAYKSTGFTVDGSGNIGGVAITGTGAVTGTSHKVGANQVVGARVTGYTAMTGSPDKATAYATGSVTIAQLAGRVAQLQADLTAHGLIGT